MGLVGKLHPLLVHFPIALVLAAAGAEVMALFSPSGGWRRIAVANLRFGAALGALTAGAGWALAATPLVDPSPELAWHRWTGIAAAVVALAAAGFTLRANGRVRRLYQVSLLAAALLVGMAGHLGGTLVWGAGFFRP